MAIKIEACAAQGVYQRHYQDQNGLLGWQNAQVWRAIAQLRAKRMLQRDDDVYGRWARWLSSVHRIKRREQFISSNKIFVKTQSISYRRDKLLNVDTLVHFDITLILLINKSLQQFDQNMRDSEIIRIKLVYGFGNLGNDLITASYVVQLFVHFFKIKWLDYNADFIFVKILFLKKWDHPFYEWLNLIRSRQVPFFCLVSSVATLFTGYIVNNISPFARRSIKSLTWTSHIKNFIKSNNFRDKNRQGQGTARGSKRIFSIPAIGLNKLPAHLKLSTSRFCVFRILQQRAHIARRKLHCVRTDQFRDCRLLSIHAFLCWGDRLSPRLCFEHTVHQTGKRSRWRGRSGHEWYTCWLISGIDLETQRNDKISQSPIKRVIVRV